MTSSTSCNANPEARDECGDDRIRAEAEGGGEVVVYKKGAWSKEEDEKLKRAVEEYGIKNWVKIERLSGLGRPAKNCRLRWLNYLRPNLKKHPFTEEEEKLILDLHFKYGNSWARIASQVAGRSDNEIKNFWHKRVKKCRREKLPIYPTKSNMQKQSHTNVSINPNHSTTITNQEPIPINPNANLNTSCIIPNHTLTIVNNSHLPTHPPSTHLHSPQTVIQSQFLSSPSTLLLTSSSHHQQSPTTHFPQHLTPTSLTISHHLQAPDALSSLFTKPPPILSKRPFFTATSQLSPPSGDHSRSVSANLVANASAMDSPISPQIPPHYSGFQLNLPTTPPLKLCSSFHVPSESCFQSHLSIPDSTVQLNSLELSQPMAVDTNDTIPPESSPTVKGEPPSIQSHQPETSRVNSSVHEEESDSNLEIMDELREAQARVRFLKKKLRQRRISNKRSLPKVSRNEPLHHESSEASDLLRTEVPLDGNSSQSVMKDCALSHTSPQAKDLLGQDSKMLKRNIRMDDMIGISKPKVLQVKKAKKEYQENLESGEDMQGSTNLEKITHGVSSESRVSSEKSLQREEDLLDHLNIQNSVSDPLRILQGLAGKYSNECSSMESFLSESSSTLLQDSFLKGDLFSQTSQTEHPFSSQRHTPLIDAFGQFYNQSNATTLVKPGDEGGQLIYLQSDDGLMDGNLAARSILHESNMLMHTNSTSAHLLDSDYLGCEQFSLHNSGGRSSESQPSFIQHQYHAADLLDSGYLTSKQLMEQESLGGARFSLQTDGCGSSSETPNLCESAFDLLHQSPESSLIDARYLVGFEHESQSVEQYCHQTWEQYDEPNSWLERQMVSQDQIFAINSLDQIVNPMESMNWNNESTSGYTGVLHQVQEQQQDHMNTMPEELSSLLDFFPTTMQTLEWCSIDNEIPVIITSNEIEHDMGLGLQMSSTS